MNKTLLQNVFPFFDRDLIEGIMAVGEELHFTAGQVILKQGRYFTRTFIVLSGCVKLYKESADGGEFIITYLGQGDSFAVSISEDSPENIKKSLVSFTAIETTHLLGIDFNEKDLLAHHYNQWYKYILRTAVKYYAVYQDLIDNIAFKKMDLRIEYFLTRLSKTKENTVLQITHQEIADGLNSSREVISRLLKKMEETGKIKLMHNSIHLLYL